MKILIKNANFTDIINEKEFKADILINKTKIEKIAPLINEKRCKIIDVNGQRVTPGLVDPHCHIGLYEEGVGEIGHLGNEKSDPVTSNLDAIYAINPKDEAFKNALKAGVTSVVTGPGSANVIGGTFTALKTYGENIEEMVIKEKVAMKSALGENPIRIYKNQNKSPMTRMAIAAIFRETLIKAKNYLKKEDKDIDFKLEALKDVLNKNMILKIHAHRSDDIITAIRISKEFNLNFTIEHCSEGHLIAKYLKSNNVKVILGPLMASKPKYELKNLTLKSASILEENGIEFALCTDHPVIPIEYHAVQAGLTIREGLSYMKALKAITINAARLTNIDDKVGSLEEGKDADLVVWESSPFDILKKPLLVMINGEVVYSNGSFIVK